MRVVAQRRCHTAHLDLCLLGGLAARLDGQAINGFDSDKSRALLAYLAVEADRPHRREALAALLWPDRSASSARSSLSQALYNLRSILGDRQHSAGEGPATPFLSIHGEMIQLNPASDHHVDAAYFLSLLAACAEHTHPLGQECNACVQNLGEAVTLYRGAFLEDLAIGDSVPFEEWATVRREQLRRRMLDALQRLVMSYERRGAYDRGLAYAWRQVEMEPWREEGQRQLMRLLALGGQRSAALAQYEACRKALAEELDVEPDAETVALYEAIRQGTLGTARPAEVSLTHPTAAEARDDEPEGPEPPRLLFVAREQELAQLERWLGEALRGQGRVGFVIGEPGSGKTMLLREFARRAMEAHPEVVAAGGSCNAYAGIGDPYLPFVEALRLLIGDVEGQRAAGALSREHARRLVEVAPVALGAVLQEGPSLVDTLLPGAVLLERARALPDGAAWEAQVREALSHRMATSQASLFDHATRVLQAVARSRPLLLILDDWQWADTASIALLFHLGRRLAGHRLLLLGAYRPEEVATGRDGQPHPLRPVLLELGALWDENEIDLAQAGGGEFVDALVDSEPNRLGTSFRQALYQHTGGHALFTVELLRGLQQQGNLTRDAEGCWREGAALDWASLPKRVEAVVAAHIIRLPPGDQELLTVASVEGEEFHAEVAARVLGRSEGEVIASLSGSLGQEHRLLRPISLRRLGELPSTAGSSPRMGWFSRYRFRHYLFQRYLYQRLDPGRRAHLHGEVAEALVGLGATPSRPEASAALLMVDDRSDVLEGPDWIASEATMARHYEEAGLVDEAAAYHAWAGRRIVLLSFHFDEATAHYAKALSLLQSVADTPSRLRRAYLACHSLAWTQSMAVGWLGPQAGRTWRQALALAERSGDRFLVAHALVFLSIYYRMRANMDASAATAERAVSLAQGGLADWVLWVEGTLAGVLQLRGEVARAARLLAPLDEALIRSRSIPPPPLNTENLALLPRTWWCLGYAGRAMEVACALQAYMLERHEFQFGMRAAVLFNAMAVPHQLSGDVEALERDIQVLRPLVEQKRCFPTFVPQIALLEGWLHTHRGAMEQGIAEMRAALSAWSRLQIRTRPYYKGMIAEALGRAGRVEEGLVYLESALKQVERTNERWYEAELWRLKGELLLRKMGDWEREGRGITEGTEAALRERRGGGQEENPESGWGAEVGTYRRQAEECFRRSIGVAQGQEAKSWELRATTSLARLLRSQGRGAEAREILAAIYGWFTEGFDTPDLVEARALLEELAPVST